MPHLSPMNWLLIILTIWLSIMTMTTMLFFSAPSKFLPPKYKSETLKSPSWLW
nr:ATP synthase F0 subunit 8 [Tubifex tubifex]